MKKADITSLIYNKRCPKPSILANIKLNEDPNKFYKTIQSFQILKKIRSSKYAFYDLKSIEERRTYQYTGNFNRELSWCLFDFIEHAKMIDEFLVDKKEFEKLFLLNKYHDAEELLKSMEIHYGINLWSIEMSLLLKEYAYDTKENWLLLSDYLSQIGSNLYRFCINCFSKRIEKNMSFRNWLNQFTYEINSLNTSNGIKDFLICKNFYIAEADYDSDNLEPVLHFSNRLGYIDQYLLVIEVLIKIVSKTKDVDNYICSFINEISTFIKADQRLLSIQNLIETGPNLQLKETHKQNEQIKEALNLFASSQYDKCKNTCFYFLPENSNCFELYELYIKSLIKLDLKFSRTGISGNIDSILESVYHVLLYDVKTEESLFLLLKYAVVYSSFDLGKQICSFANYINGSSISHQTIGYLSSQITNHRLLLYSNNRSDLLWNKMNKCNDIPCKINGYIMGYLPEIEDIISDKEQFFVYKLKQAYFQKRYMDTILLIGNLEIKPCSYHYLDFIRILFDSYIKSNRVEDAIKYSINIFIENPMLFRLIEVEPLIRKITDNGIELYSALIETPILFSFVTKEYDLYVVYDEFMSHHEFLYPSVIEHDEFIYKFSKEKMVYFLSKVCTVETLRYCLDFESINDVEQERIKICDYLNTIDTVNKETYSKEIENILKAQAVRKVIKEVDNARLFVNIENLKKMYSGTIKESFTRYKQIEHVSSERNLIGYNADKDTISSNEELVPIEKRVNIVNELNSPAFLAFKAMFNEIREKFLYSKEYGLESCLSTRIRHGALKNHIRSVFEKLNLITSKANEGNYVCNEYWMNYFEGCDNETKMKIQDNLKDFSLSIDKKTNYIVDNLIQIQTENSIDKQEGLFNFCVDDTILYTFYYSIKNQLETADKLVDLISNDLTASISLHISPLIRDYFSNGLISEYVKIIEQLQINMRELDIPHYNEILTNLTKASTDIQTELSKISDWFILRTTDSGSLLDIETVINASKEYTNKINPNYFLNVEVINSTDVEVITSIHMIFVFNILFNNVIKHSGLEPDENEVSITISQHENNIEIKCKNKLSKDIDLGDIRKRLEHVKLNWTNNENIEGSNFEGRSGFDKIKRIFIYEIGAQKHDFNYSIFEDNVAISLFLPLIDNI